MKQHIKKLSILFLLAALLASCDAEEMYLKEKNSNNGEPVIKTLSYKEAGETFNRLKNELKIEKHLKTPESSNLQARTIKDTLGFLIETDLIKQVTLGEYKSYTMKLVKEIEGNIFFNLTIENKNGESSMFMTCYIPSSYWVNNKDEAFQGVIVSRRMNTLTQYQEPEILFDDIINSHFNHDLGTSPGGGGSYSLQNGSPYYPFDCNGYVIVSIKLVPYPCGCEGAHMPWNTNECDCEDNPSGYDEIPYYYCQEYPNLGGSNPDNPTNPSTGGPTTPNPDDTSITAMIKPEECLERIVGDLNRDCQLSPYETCLLGGNSQEVCDCVKAGGKLADCQDEVDCLNLSNLLGANKTKLNEVITELATKHNANIKKEHAYVFKKTIQYSDPITDEVTYTYLENTEFVGTATSITIVTDTKTYADIHLHTKGHGAASGLFSWGDIYNFGEFYSGLSNAQPAATFKEKNDISTMVFAPDPLNENNYNVYALTVKDANQLNAARQNEWNSPKWSRYTDVKKRIGKINRDFGEKYNENKNRLERFFLDTFNSYGITLYKLENNQWKELTPDTSNSNAVTKKPCE